MKVAEIKNVLNGEEISRRYGGSAWKRAELQYAKEIIEYFDSETDITNKKQLLNGAENWSDYSYGGCALIYDEDIAKRVCTPSELKKKDNGRLAPNSRENWLDVQARILQRAAWIILYTAKRHDKSNN